MKRITTFLDKLEKILKEDPDYYPFKYTLERKHKEMRARLEIEKNTPNPNLVRAHRLNELSKVRLRAVQRENARAAVIRTAEKIIHGAYRRKRVHSLF